MDTNASLRSLPQVEAVLSAPELAETLGSVPRQLVVDAVRDAIGGIRETLLAGQSAETDVGSIARSAARDALLAMHPSLHGVINATGIIVHTNLGRSVLSKAAADAVAEVATAYSTLEYDVENGERGTRHVHVEEHLCRLTGAEAAMAVNNNAGAVMLAIAGLARGQEAIVSRGQLVEIGGSFRIPDIMAESGATMVEVGTTNKTNLDDYERALTESTGLLLKVHASNFRVVGFTEQASLEELVRLGARHGVPVMEDQGSGVFFDLRPHGITHEPTVAESVSAGAAVVTASGDKLLGGPQAGILVGRWDVISKLKKHPMARALRLDKLTLAALEATLRASLDMRQALSEIPTLRMLSEPASEVGARAEELATRIRGVLGDAAEVAVVEEVARAGGGALPLADIPTVVVAIRPHAMSVEELETSLRRGEPTIVVRVKEDRVLIDPRTLLSSAEHDAIVTRLGEISGS
jgi:L-seryl-tRNA(Ser) seleniumtransferase